MQATLSTGMVYSKMMTANKRHSTPSPPFLPKELNPPWDKHVRVHVHPHAPKIDITQRPPYIMIVYTIPIDSLLFLRNPSVVQNYAFIQYHENKNCNKRIKRLPLLKSHTIYKTLGGTKSFLLMSHLPFIV